MNLCSAESKSLFTCIFICLQTVQLIQEQVQELYKYILLSTLRVNTSKSINAESFDRYQGQYIYKTVKIKLSYFRII